jgi:D-alanine-D-alanine ligase
MTHKYRVAVLMGGVGGERMVSLESGRCVAAALSSLGHDVVPYEVAEPALPGLRRLAPDVAFVALHGPFGEDGQVQKLLENMGLPYTGSDPVASRLGMNKLASKRLFVRHSVPTPDYVTVPGHEPAEAAARRALELGYPVVCKPVASGSSLGVSLVRTAREMPAALARARRHGDGVLVESWVRGRELTVAVLDGEPLPVVEVIPRGDMFDYEAKYEDEGTRYVTPVAMLPTVYRRTVEAGLRAYEAIGCRHMARVDLRYGYDGEIAVLEVNTIPGMTPRSLLPLAAAEAGLSFAELCEGLVKAALRDATAATRRRLSA